MWEVSHQFGMPRLPVWQLAEVGFPDNCAERGVSTASLLRAAGYTVTCRRDDGTGFLGEDADRYLEAI
jgi:hypothetical protein